MACRSYRVHKIQGAGPHRRLCLEKNLLPWCRKKNNLLAEYSCPIFLENRCVIPVSHSVTPQLPHSSVVRRQRGMAGGNSSNESISCQVIEASLHMGSPTKEEVLIDEYVGVPN